MSDMRIVTPEEIEATARAIVSARTTNLGIEVTTPVVYPNGDLVTVAVTIEGGEYVVHDAGFGAMYLNSAGVRLTRQLTHRFVELAARYGCEFIAGRMTRRCSPEQVAMAAVMVANASRTVGDQALEIRRQTENDFRIAVVERLRDIAGNRVRENQAVKGESGRSYRIPSLILDSSQSFPLAFVVPLPNRAAVSDRFAEFFDIRRAHDRVRRESVYDESSDIRAEDLRLMRMENMSEMIPFQQTRVRFAQLITAE
jgi:hypothetical protein